MQGTDHFSEYPYCSSCKTSFLTWTDSINSLFSLDAIFHANSGSSLSSWNPKSTESTAEKMIENARSNFHELDSKDRNQKHYQNAAHSPSGCSSWLKYSSLSSPYVISGSVYNLDVLDLVKSGLSWSEKSRKRPECRISNKQKASSVFRVCNLRIRDTYDDSLEVAIVVVFARVGLSISKSEHDLPSTTFHSLNDGRKRHEKQGPMYRKTDGTLAHQQPKKNLGKGWISGRGLHNTHGKVRPPRMRVPW